MSIINYASREIQFKIVYYGPALCGKLPTLATSISGLIRKTAAISFRSLPQPIAPCSSTFSRSTLWLSKALSPSSSSIPSPVR